MDSLFKTIILPVIIFGGIIVFGTLGYMYFNHISWVDALQLVVVTIATCGIRQAGDNTLWAKLFDITFIIGSFAVIITVLSRTLSLVVEGQLRGITERDKMRKTIRVLKNHYVICGFGRVGHQVAQQLMTQKFPLMVIDNKPEVVQDLQDLKIPYIIGTASQDDVLKQAHIDKARAVVICSDSDVENVFITLSVRTMNPGIMIIARASDPSNEEKMRRAGANHIISPYLTAGQRISGLLLNPSVSDFLDRVLHDQNLEVWFHEVKVPRASKLIGQSLADINLRKKAGVVVVAVRHKDGSFNMNTDGDTVVCAEDTFICLGSVEQIASLRSLF